MDVQRVILVAALALISYMLVLQWNEDYGKPQTAQAPVASVSAYGSSTAAASSDSDLPTADSKTPADIPATTSSVSNAQAQLISVKTDVLDVLIDTKGGDIIQVALPAHKASIDSDLPFVLLEQTVNRVYVSQSGLVGPNGPDANPEGRPTYRAEKSEYVVDESGSVNVDLTFTDKQGVQITKRYTFTQGAYTIDLNYIINNQSAAPFQANLFGQIKRDRSADPNASTDMGMQSYLGPAFSTSEEKYREYDFDNIDEAQFKQTSQDGWVAMVQHYFISAWIPSPGAEYTYSSRKLHDKYIVGFVSPVLSVSPSEEKIISASFFVGPKDEEQMEAAAPGRELDLTLDFSWLWWIATPLYSVLKWLYGILGNWGLAIISITVLVKAALFQVNAKAFKSMAKMRKFGPEMTRLKELYGDDRQKMSQAMMELYKKEKINPLGGCLPILAQMPIFIALYWVLMEAVELRHAEFLYLTDLSVKDPYFILPIIMGASMFIQQMLNPTPPDPMQAKIMKMLPIMFTFFFLWFPAGLTLYWVVNNILSIAQQYVINKQIEAAPSGS
ncbi:membrane protein insertase YidC [Neptunomonas concharum]|uniref:Membrane protein insertase YidC n=1 Tax=Neptunomonas concharum TaxID=1031538 RepID=A0A5P1RF69_9GAMM|nr:membrane protein insertase YidC [Neptunomonas concharum]QEQ98257.1 membrane protein insertase YidC [Neptunomonas concharum]